MRICSYCRQEIEPQDDFLIQAGYTAAHMLCPKSPVKSTAVSSDWDWSNNPKVHCTLTVLALSCIAYVTHVFLKSPEMTTNLISFT